MSAVVRVAGERLSELLRHPPAALTEVEVTSAPPSWAPLKPLLLQLVRSYRDRGHEPPRFGGVPLCLFGSEWPGFPSRARTTPPLGRCAPCLARRSCGFAAAVPDELLAISETSALARWRDWAAAFRRVTESDAATAATPLVERILAAYRGPISLEPSVLLTGAVEPAARLVVFPHHMARGAAAAAEWREALTSLRGLTAEIGADSADLVDALASLPPLPLPIGFEGSAGSWRLKVYLRLEERTAAEKQAVLRALARSGAGLDAVSPSGLEMLGLVLDGDGLHTVKAYVAARPSRRERAAFPAPLAADHPLVALSGDRALATLDVWGRGPRRADKWDVNLRAHYLAGASAERLVERIAPPGSAAGLRPLLVAPAYRADVVAVGVRAATVALYLELN